MCASDKYVHMKHRTTLELDLDLLNRAKRALGSRTMRETVERALRLAAERPDAAALDRRKLQLSYLSEVADRVDAKVLASEDMWR